MSHSFDNIIQPIYIQKCLFLPLYNIFIMIYQKLYEYPYSFIEEDIKKQYQINDLVVKTSQFIAFGLSIKLERIMTEKSQKIEFELKQKHLVEEFMQKISIVKVGMRSPEQIMYFSLYMKTQFQFVIGANNHYYVFLKYSPIHIQKILQFSIEELNIRSSSRISQSQVDTTFLHKQKFNFAIKIYKEINKNQMPYWNFNDQQTVIVSGEERIVRNFIYWMMYIVNEMVSVDIQKNGNKQMNSQQINYIRVKQKLFKFKFFSDKHRRIILYRTSSNLNLLKRKIQQPWALIKKQFIPQIERVLSSEEYYITQKIICNNLYVSEEVNGFIGPQYEIYRIQSLYHKFSNDSQQSFQDNSMLDSNLLQQRKIYNWNSIQITSKNYKKALHKMISLKAINFNRFQFYFQEKVVISNRCHGINKIFIVFSKSWQLIELQSLFEREWKLASIQTIIKQFQNSQTKMKLVQFQSEEYYFFRLQNENYWKIYIQQINKRQKNNNAIILKGNLFDQLFEKIHQLNGNTKVIIHEDEQFFDDSQVSSFRVFENIENLNIKKEQIIAIATHNHKEYRIDKYWIDSITAFNIEILKHRNTKKIYIVETKLQPQKEYIYLTFYKKLYLITNYWNKYPIQLIEVESKNQFKGFRESNFEVIKKWAVVNHIQFFYFSNNIEEIIEINPQQIHKSNSQDATKMLVYQMFASSQKFIVEIDRKFTQRQVKKQILKKQQIWFENSSIMLKIGALVDVNWQIQKFRRGKGYGIKANLEYCKIFIDLIKKQSNKKSNKQNQKKQKNPFTGIIKPKK